MHHPDAIIIGSGFGGAITALRLAKDGRKVLVLEQGKRLHPYKDFKLSWSPKYLTGFYRHFLNPADNFLYYYASLMGGGSVLFAAACPRAPSEVFTHEDEATGINRWPKEVTRAVLDPYYEEIEELLHIHHHEWEEIDRLGSAMAQMFHNAGKSCDRVPMALKGCRVIGQCQAGCPIGAKMTLLHDVIPMAEKLGAEFHPESDALFIKPAADGRWEVTYRHKGADRKRVRAAVVVLAGGVIGTPALLLRSRPHLDRLSKATGKHMHNNGDVPFGFELPEHWHGKHFHFSIYKGRNNPGVMSYGYWDALKITFHPGSTPPAIFAGLDFYKPDGTPPIGLGYKRWVTDLYKSDRFIPCLTMGMAPPAGSVGIDGKGEPTISFDRRKMSVYLSRVARVIKEVAHANRAKVLYTAPDRTFALGGAHGMGSCRMGYDPADAVSSPYGEVFGYHKLYIADGSLLPGGVGVNPSLTIAANAARIADHILESS